MNVNHFKLVLQLIQFVPIYKKNWKTCNLANVDKKKYDSNMNSSRVVIDNAFDFLKHICILKHFNPRID
jgi:hypothetical protein